MAQREAPRRAGARLDRAEIGEWLAALDDVLRRHGTDEARRLLGLLEAHGRAGGLPAGLSLSTPYVNTIPRSAEPPYPGDWPIERQIKSVVRWN